MKTIHDHSTRVRRFVVFGLFMWKESNLRTSRNGYGVEVFLLVTSFKRVGVVEP
jgi:hypothetical protein